MALTNIPLTRDMSVPSPTAAYGMSAETTFIMLAQLLKLRDPMLFVPPTTSLLARNPLEDMGVAMDVIRPATIASDLARLAALAADVRMASAGSGWVNPPNTASPGRQTAPVIPGAEIWRSTIVRVNALRLEATALTRSDRLSAFPSSNPTETALTSLLSDLTPGASTGTWNEDPLAFNGPDKRFADLIIALAYRRILASPLFAGGSTADDTAERSRHISVERVVRTMALGYISLMQLRLMRLRQRIRYVMIPEHRTRIEESQSKTAVAELFELANKILALPVHPWIAVAESFTLPSSRRTLWGVSTPTAGLDTSHLTNGAISDAIGSGDDLYSITVPANIHVNPIEIFLSITQHIRDVSAVIESLQTNNVLTDVMSALGFTSVGSPRSIALHGADVKVLHSDKLNFSDSMTDLFDAAMRLHFPRDVQGDARSRWIAPSSLLLAAVSDLARPQGASTDLLIEPEIPVRSPDYHFERFQPKSIQVLPVTYRGDPGFVALPYDAAEFLRSINEDPTVIAGRLTNREATPWAEHMSVVDGRVAWRTDSEGNQIPRYVSSATEMTWAKSYTLPSTLAPQGIVALQRGVPFASAKLGSRFLVSPEIPETPFPAARAITATLAVVEKAFR